MLQSDLHRYGKPELKKFLNNAIDKISQVKELKPSRKLFKPPHAMRMDFNINYTNEAHSEIVYLTIDMEIAVMKFDSEARIVETVFLKTIDFMLDLLPKNRHYYKSFFINCEPITQDGVEGYFKQGKPFQVGFVSISERRAFLHIMQLCKNMESGDETIKLIHSTDIMGHIMKLRYNIKDENAFTKCPLTGRKVITQEVLEKYINKLSWHDDLSSVVKFKHPGNYFKAKEKIRYLYFEFLSEFSFNKYKITTYRIYLKSGFIKRVSVHFSYGVRANNQNNLIYQNFHSKKFFSHHIYQKIASHVVKGFIDPDASDPSSDNEITRELFLTTYNLVSQKKIKTIKIQFDPRKVADEFKELDKEFYRGLLPKISNFLHFQDAKTYGNAQVIGHYKPGYVDRENLLINDIQYEPAFLYLNLIQSSAQVMYKSCPKKNMEELADERIVGVYKCDELSLEDLMKHYSFSGYSSWYSLFNPNKPWGAQNLKSRFNLDENTKTVSSKGSLFIFYVSLNKQQGFVTRYSPLEAPPPGVEITQVLDKLPWKTCTDEDIEAKSSPSELERRTMILNNRFNHLVIWNPLMRTHSYPFSNPLAIQDRFICKGVECTGDIGLSPGLIHFRIKEFYTYCEPFGDAPSYAFDKDFRNIKLEDKVTRNFHEFYKEATKRYGKALKKAYMKNYDPYYDNSDSGEFIEDGERVTNALHKQVKHVLREGQYNILLGLITFKLRWEDAIPKNYILILYDELRQNPKRLYNVYIQDEDLLDEAKMVIIYDKSQEMHKVLLFCHQQKELFHTNELALTEDELFKMIDLTPVLQPTEENKGEAIFCHFFNFNKDENQDIVDSGIFNKLNSEDEVDYFHDDFFYPFGGNVENCEKAYFISLENKKLQTVHIFMKSYLDIQGQWTRLDIPVDPSVYTEIDYDLDAFMVNFKLEDEDEEHDLINVIFFDLVTQTKIEVDDSEIYKKLGVDRSKDHPDSYNLSNKFEYRLGNKVVYSFTKSEVYSDAKGNYDDYIGQSDTRHLKIELDFSAGTYQIVFETKVHFTMGQESFNSNYQITEPHFFGINNSIYYNHKNLKLFNLKPRTIKEGLQVARESLKKDDLVTAFEVLTSLYFMEQYAGTRLHSCFQYKNFLKYIGPRYSTKRGHAESYLENLQVKMIKNNYRFSDRYSDRAIDTLRDNAMVFLPNMIIQSLEEHEQFIKERINYWKARKERVADRKRRKESNPDAEVSESEEENDEIVPEGEDPDFYNRNKYDASEYDKGFQMYEILNCDFDDIDLDDIDLNLDFSNTEEN